MAIPKLRQGSYFPDWLLERRRRRTKVGNGSAAAKPHADDGGHVLGADAMEVQMH